MRPWGFREYVKSQGFHSVYLITPISGSPLKVGISEDPLQRMLGLQNAHFDELRFHRFWWLPGVQVAARIESAFKKHFANRNIRGEWFDLGPAEAVEFVEAAIAQIGVWSATQSEMERLQDQWMRKRYGVARHAPSPLRGNGPRSREPWERDAR